MKWANERVGYQRKLNHMQAFTILNVLIVVQHRNLTVLLPFSAHIPHTELSYNFARSDPHFGFFWDFRSMQFCSQP